MHWFHSLVSYYPVSWRLLAYEKALSLEIPRQYFLVAYLEQIWQLVAFSPTCLDL